MPVVSASSSSSGSTTTPNAASSKKGLSGGAARATGLTIGLVLLSRVLGVIRDMVLTTQFGQNENTTIFGAAFRVPDLIALVLAGGALSSVFVPVFTQYWNEGKEEDSWKVFGSITSIAAVIVAALVLLLEIGAEPLTHLLNPKFESAYAITNTTWLSRILLPAQWFLLVGGLIMGTLYARKRFLVPGLAPLLYNLGQIIGGIIGGMLHPHSIEGLAFMAWGATVGAFAGSIVLPCLDLWRSKVPFRFSLDTSHPGVRRVGVLMVPVLLGQSLGPLNIWMTGLFTGEDARFSAFRISYNLTQAPIGIFAQAFAIVLLPTISALATKKDWPAFRSTVSDGLRRVLFLTMPASTLMAALSYPLIRIFFKAGRFTEADVPLAAAALIGYSLATFAWSGSSILQRGFWAVQDTRTPIYITTPLVFAFLGTGWLYSTIDPQGSIGFPLATSFYGTVSMLLFLFFLNKRLQTDEGGGLDIREIVVGALRILMASLLSGAVAYGACRFLEQHLPLTKTGSMLVVLIAGSIGLVIYTAIAVILKMPELRGIKEMFRRRSSVSSDAGSTAPE
jgi:putative peptidoglycan lipid II flippase